MGALDILIILILGVSAVISLWRGFTREAVSLATWVAAFLVARLFGPTFAVLVEQWVEQPVVAVIVAFAVLFVATLIVGSMLANLAGDIIRRTGLSGVDRAMGTVFGLARGAIIVLVLCVITQPWFSGYPWWKESQLVPYFLVMERWSRNTLGNVLGADTGLPAIEAGSRWARISTRAEQTCVAS